MGTAYIVESRSKMFSVRIQDRLLWYDQGEAVEVPKVVHADITWIKPTQKFEISFAGPTVPIVLIVKDGDGDEFHVYRRRQLAGDSAAFF
jgi:hypothetical protein